MGDLHSFDCLNEKTNKITSINLRPVDFIVSDVINEQLEFVKRFEKKTYENYLLFDIICWLYLNE